SADLEKLPAGKAVTGPVFGSAQVQHEEFAPKGGTATLEVGRRSSSSLTVVIDIKFHWIYLYVYWQERAQSLFNRRFNSAGKRPGRFEILRISGVRFIRQNTCLLRFISRAGARPNG